MNNSKNGTEQLSIPGLPLGTSAKIEEPGGMRHLLETLQKQNQMSIAMFHRDLVFGISECGDRLVHDLWAQASELRAAAEKIQKAAQRELESRANQ